MRTLYSPDQHGYTLIELLLYISIIGGLLTAVTLFFGTAIDTRIKTQSIAEVDQQGALAADTIAQTIRGADSITLPSSGTSAASMSLAVPTVALSPTVINLNGTTLQIKEGGSPVTALTSPNVQVTGLTFVNLTRASTPGIVQVTFTVARTNISGRNEYSYQKTFTTSTALRWP
jgi:type II secretory pathway pseudopilin PulG